MPVLVTVLREGDDEQRAQVLDIVGNEDVGWRCEHEDLARAGKPLAELLVAFRLNERGEIVDKARVALEERGFLYHVPEV